MLEVHDRMILLSGKTAETFHKNALHPPANPERDRLFAELDAMQVIERTTKKLTIELPGFDTSFLHKRIDDHAPTLTVDAVISGYVIPDMSNEQGKNYDVDVTICSSMFNTCMNPLDPSKKETIQYQHNDKLRTSNQWQTASAVSDVAA